MNLKRCLIIIAIALLGIIPTIAKGGFPILIITNNSTDDTYEISGEEDFMLSQFALFDRCSPLQADDLPELDEGYDIHRGGKLMNVFEPFDKLVYYPNVIGRRGVIHYVGLVNANDTPDGSSEFDDRWYFANPHIEPYLRELLLDERVIESPFQQAFIRYLVGEC